MSNKKQTDENGKPITYWGGLSENKKQTAVEWVRDRLQSRMGFGEIIDLLDQAKAMEKEQIINAISKGWDNNENGKVKWIGEQYYKETYEL